MCSVNAENMLRLILATRCVGLRLITAREASFVMEAIDEYTGITDIGLL